MFLLIGLLCAGIASATLVASEAKSTEFKALPNLRFEGRSLGIIAQLRAIHPDLANDCNENSPFKGRCEKMLNSLSEYGWLNVDTYDLMHRVGIRLNPESCYTNYQDPIDIHVCIRQDTAKINAIKDKLLDAQSRQIFRRVSGSERSRAEGKRLGLIGR